MNKQNEVLNKERITWEYFPDKDLRKIKSKTKGNLVTKFMIGCIKVMVPEISLMEGGFYKVRYFEFVNVKTGKVRLVKAEECLK